LEFTKVARLGLGLYKKWTLSRKNFGKIAGELRGLRREMSDDRNIARAFSQRPVEEGKQATTVGEPDRRSDQAFFSRQSPPMPKSAKKRKDKAADFSKAKLKLGKGKQLASNAIDTSFKARCALDPLARASAECAFSHCPTVAKYHRGQER
jgi:hypothetical protein